MPVANRFDGILDAEFVTSIDAVGRTVDDQWELLETSCRLPPDIVGQARDAGLFQLLGNESLMHAVGPEGWFEASLRCSWWNPSLGWICAHSSAIAAQLSVVSPGLFGEIQRECPNPIFAGTTAGMVSLREQQDDWLVEGQVGFVSGVEVATHVVTLGLEPGQEPSPENLQLVLAPTSAWEIVRDWDPIGLRGTGSHSIRPSTGTIKRHESLRVSAKPSPQSKPSMRIFTASVAGAWFIAFSVAATQLGIARRAIDECIDLVADKVAPPLFDRIADRQTVRTQVMEMEGRWLQAYGGCVRALTDIWRQACDGVPIRDRTRALLATSAHLANRDSIELVQQACQLAGTSMLHSQHPLARCHRDVQPLIGHVSSNAAILDFAAKRLAGDDEGAAFV